MYDWNFGVEHVVHSKIPYVWIVLDTVAFSCRPGILHESGIGNTFAKFELVGYCRRSSVYFSRLIECL